MEPGANFVENDDTVEKFTLYQALNQSQAQNAFSPFAQGELGSNRCQKPDHKTPDSKPVERATVPASRIT
jgi:hypothetical protein